MDLRRAAAFVIASDRLGHGDDELGELLMKNFIYSLARAEATPRTVGFMNGGVRLACEGSPALEDIRLLAEAGVKIRSCGTCLDFLGLRDKLAVGEVGTMPDTAALLAAGDAVVIG